VAIRSVQDVLKWMLTDHLGSASVTANENGTWNSTIQYTAFGEVRAKNGVTPGSYRYTGQLEQAELGLYYYVARWYDPAIAHFAQADTIGLDRYSYVGYNPIRLIDPSGHMACEGTGDCRAPKKTKFTKQDYINMSQEEFGWTITTNSKNVYAPYIVVGIPVITSVKPDNFSYAEVKTIYETGLQILQYANETVAGGAGYGWMMENMGNITIRHNPFLTTKATNAWGYDSSMGPTSTMVLLNTNWLDTENILSSKLTLAHELGHISDSRSAPLGMGVWTGGGYGDQMAWRLDPEVMPSVHNSIRWIEGNLNSMASNMRWGSKGIGDVPYGNNSSADYFAHTFAYAVFAPAYAPPQSIEYLNYLLGSQ